MPFYTWLRPRRGDSMSTLEHKRRVTGKLLDLREAIRDHIEDQPLDDHLPAPGDSAQVLRLATWNIREFDSNSYGKRSREAKAYIAEILSHFDLIAVQEVREDLRALDDVMDLLGPGWKSLATDVTAGSAGNRERMVYVYNTDKVWFRRVAGEVTLKPEDRVTDPFGERFQVAGGPELALPAGQQLASPANLRIKVDSTGSKLDEEVEIALPAGTRLTAPDGASIYFAKGSRLAFTAGGAIDLPQGNEIRLPEEAIFKLPENSIVGGPMQFARTPYIASFQAGWLKVNLCTVHIYYGKGSRGLARRNEEIRRLTGALADRAKSDSDSDADAYFIALGDFNIVGRNHETMDSLTTNDFKVPLALQTVPGSNVAQDKAYDQIAIWTGESKRRKSYTRIQTYRAGVFDFFDTVYRLDEEAIYRPRMRKADGTQYNSYKTWRTHQMSDHLPMWIELHIDFSDAYLETVQSQLDREIGL